MARDKKNFRKKLDLRTGPKVVQAEYYSVCEICLGDIVPGDKIVHVEGEWVHHECAEEEGYL